MIPSAIVPSNRFIVNRTFVSACVFGSVVFPGSCRRQIVDSKCLVKGENTFVLVTDPVCQPDDMLSF